jgi:hypothetical protein
MKRIVYHIIIPAIMPSAFFVIASTPVEVLGLPHSRINSTADCFYQWSGGIGCGDHWSEGTGARRYKCYLVGEKHTDLGDTGYRPHPYGIVTPNLSMASPRQDKDSP